MLDNDKALEQRARRAARWHWTSVLRWDPLGRLRRSCASDPRRRYEYEAVFQAQVIETLQPAAPDEYQPGCFALEEERGGNWKGSGGSVPSIKEAKPSL